MLAVVHTAVASMESDKIQSSCFSILCDQRGQKLMKQFEVPEQKAAQMQKCVVSAAGGSSSSVRGMTAMQLGSSQQR